MSTLPSTVVAAGAAAGAAGLSALLTEPMRRLALRRGYTDRPAAHKAHVRPTPYLGGIALAAATLIPVLALTHAWTWPLGSLVLAGLAIAALGLVDDVRQLRQATRLIVEAGAASVVVCFGGLPHITGAFWPDAALTVGWIVIMTNSFNLLDNMDGAAASVAAATSASLGCLAYLAGQGNLALILLCLTGACVGFLLHNGPPARIFMGDAGSLFIGFILSCATARLGGSGTGLTATTAVLITFVAVLDTTVVVVSRQVAGRSWFLGGTDHVSHRLRRLGLNTPQVMAVLFAGAATTGALGVLVARGVLPGAPVIIAAAVAGVALVWLLTRVRVYERASTPAPDTPSLVRRQL